MVLVGDGLRRRALGALINELGLASRVSMPGMVALDEVADHLVKADAYVCASQTETQGLALIEAMAIGLPCAAMDAPGSRDVITNEVDGLLTAPNPEALAAAMLRMAQDRALGQRLAVQARQVTQRYDPLQLTIRLLEVYRQTINTFRQLSTQREEYAMDAMSVE